MGDFQTKVGVPARSRPGRSLNRDSQVTTAKNYLSDGTLEPGGFAFVGQSVAGQDVCFASKSVSGGHLLGIVMRTDVGTFNSPSASYASTYQKGAPVTILARGQVCAVVPDGQTPTEFQAVLCDPATGAVTYGAEGSANDTGWNVLFFTGQASAAEGDLVIYENLGRTPCKSS